MNITQLKFEVTKVPLNLLHVRNTVIKLKELLILEIFSPTVNFQFKPFFLLSKNQKFPYIVTIFTLMIQPGEFPSGFGCAPTVSHFVTLFSASTMH